MDGKETIKEVGGVLGRACVNLFEKCLKHLRELGAQQLLALLKLNLLLLHCIAALG